MTTNTALRNTDLATLQALLEDQQTRKVDVVAPATALRVRDGLLQVRGTEPVIDESGVTAADGTYTMTDPMVGQFADRLGIPIPFARSLHTDRTDLFDGLANGLIHGKTRIKADGTREVIAEPMAKSYLIRLFRGAEGTQGVARAILSNSYGVIDHLDAVVACLSGIRESGAAVGPDDIRCDLTDRGMRIRIHAPQITALAPDLLRGYRSPFTGQNGSDLPVLFAGLELSNSETGGGAYTITPRAVVQVCTNGMTATRDAVRAIHLGARKDDGVIRWSQATRDAELEVITQRTRDAVGQFLSTTYLERLIADLTGKAQRPIEGNAAEVVETVTKRLKFSEAHRAGVLDMFTRGGQMTAGGVLQAVTAYAQTVEDADQAAEVEAAGLQALEFAAAL